MLEIPLKVPVGAASVRCRTERQGGGVSAGGFMGTRHQQIATITPQTITDVPTIAAGNPVPISVATIATRFLHRTRSPERP